MTYEIKTMFGQVEYQTLEQALTVWENITRKPPTKDLLRALKSDCAHYADGVSIRPVP